MAKENSIKKKIQKLSVAEKILKVVNNQLKEAEEFKKELKDRFGHNVKPGDIRVNLFYLLRREKIKRKKEGKIYKYYV